MLVKSKKQKELMYQIKQLRRLQEDLYRTINYLQSQIEELNSKRK